MEDILKGKWKQLRGKVKERWGDLTEDDLDKFEGGRDQAVGLLQEKFGFAKEIAQKEYDDLVDSLSS